MCKNTVKTSKLNSCFIIIQKQYRLYFTLLTRTSKHKSFNEDTAIFLHLLAVLSPLDIFTPDIFIIDLRVFGLQLFCRRLTKRNRHEELQDNMELQESPDAKDFRDSGELRGVGANRTRISQHRITNDPHLSAFRIELHTLLACQPYHNKFNMIFCF